MLGSGDSRDGKWNGVAGSELTGEDGRRKMSTSFSGSMRGVSGLTTCSARGLDSSLLT